MGDRGGHLHWGRLEDHAEQQQGPAEEIAFVVQDGSDRDWDLHDPDGDDLLLCADRDEFKSVGVDEAGRVGV